jgi:ribonuclease BN (tRNA processing enzyme)
LSKLRVRVLGCRAGRPDISSACSGYLVSGGDDSVLVDCGPGVLTEMIGLGAVDGLTSIVLTHVHQDHMLDVVPLAFTRLLVDAPLPRIPLWVRAESIPMLRALDELMAVPTDPLVGRPLDTAFDIKPLTLGGEPQALGSSGIEVAAYAARHALPCASLVFTLGGRRLTFSADTGWCDGVVQAASGADLFICEATYLEADKQALEEHGHLTAAQTGQLAKLADVSHLVVTHVLDGDNEARTLAAVREHAGDREVTFAQRGLELIV